MGVEGQPAIFVAVAVARPREGSLNGKMLMPGAVVVAQQRARELEAMRRNGPPPTGV